jgi:hypothetical protein
MPARARIRVPNRRFGACTRRVGVSPLCECAEPGDSAPSARAGDHGVMRVACSAPRWRSELKAGGIRWDPADHRRQGCAAIKNGPPDFFLPPIANSPRP